MSAQPFRHPAGELRNPLGELICGYKGPDPEEPGQSLVCMKLDPCEEHGPQEPPFPPELAGVLKVCNDCARGHDCETHRFKGFPPIEPLDLHQQLKDDDQPWSPRSRLTLSLGRPALATRLADALPPPLAAELADRLDTLIRQALTEQQAAITQELSDRYHEARARLDADAAQKLKEVHDERYRGHSRLN